MTAFANDTSTCQTGLTFPVSSLADEPQKLITSPMLDGLAKDGHVPLLSPAAFSEPFENMFGIVEVTVETRHFSKLDSRSTGF